MILHKGTSPHALSLLLPPLELLAASRLPFSTLDLLGLVSNMFFLFGVLSPPVMVLPRRQTSLLPASVLLESGNLSRNNLDTVRQEPQGVDVSCERDAGCGWDA